MRTTRRSSLPADHADDTEVIPPGGSCGRHGGRPSRAANGEGPPPRGPQCMSATAMRTSRRSSLLADHADDTEVIPPDGTYGRRGGHPSRRNIRTTRRSSLPRCKRGGSASARTAVHECYGYADVTEVVPPGGTCGRRGGHPSRRNIRTTRRSSLPRCKRGRVRLRADRSACVLRLCGRRGGRPSRRSMRTTRRSSLPTDHAGVVISGG